MNISGLLGQCRPERLAECIAAVNNIPGAEVFHEDPVCGRFVIVQEAENTGQEVEIFEQIQALPGILSLSLVYHQFNDAQATAASCTPVPGALEDPA